MIVSNWLVNMLSLMRQYRVCERSINIHIAHRVINLHKKKYKHYQTFIISSIQFRHIMKWVGESGVRGWKVIETIRATPFCGTRAFLLLLLQFQQHENLRNLILLGAIGFKVKPMTIMSHFLNPIRRQSELACEQGVNVF